MTEFAGSSSSRHSSSSSSSSGSPSGRRRRSSQHRRAVEHDVATGAPWLSFDGVTECILYAMLAFSPLAFGVVAAWSREIFLLLVAAAAVVVSAKHVAHAWSGKGPGYRWSWAYPAMLAFLGLCVAQAVPLPVEWVRAVSPGTLALKTELLSDLPNVGQLLRRLTLSFYPKATIEQTALVAAVAALFAIVLDVFREPVRIRRLLSAIATVGLAVACIAGYQNLTGSTTVYAGVAAQHPNSGPFMNHSHFSQFMNLSIGAALALLLDRTAELSEFYRTPREIWAALWQPRNAAVWLWVTLCVGGPIVVLLSLSRGGMISLAVATVISGGLLLWRGRSVSGGGSDRAWVLVGLGLAVFVVLLYVGFDLVSSRLSTLGNIKDTGGGVRREILKDIAAEFKRFPLVGTGLGTHEFVFGMFDTRNSPTLATHAENEYAQLVEETGIVGAALGAVFLLGLAVSYGRAVWRPKRPIDYVAFGLGFGLIAILVHSASDFGQHLPADAALTAIFAALLTSLARRRSQPTAAPTAPRRAIPGIACATVALAVIGWAAVVGMWADRARAAESIWTATQKQNADLEANNWQGPSTTFPDLAAAAADCVALVPGDVEYRYWTGVFRYNSIPHTTNPLTGADLVQPANVPAVQRVMEYLNATRVLCPTYGALLGVEGQINRDVLGQPDVGRKQIELSCRLAPFNQNMWLLAGADALIGHRRDEASSSFHRFASLGGPVWAYADACINTGHVDIAYDIVKDDRQSLNYLISRMPANDPRWVPWITGSRSHAAKLLVAEAAKPDALPTTLADMADADVQQGKTADAIDLYRRALAGEYGNIYWRLRLAHCLADSDKPAEAAREARVVLQLRPEMAEAKTLATECDARASTEPSATPH